MASTLLSSRAPTRILIRNAHPPASEQQPAVPFSALALVQLLSHLSQVLLGVMLLLLGGALVLTLWLLPIGLPLALLGVALIAAGNSS